jgi:hypothetical protein
MGLPQDLQGGRGREDDGEQGLLYSHFMQSQVSSGCWTLVYQCLLLTAVYKVVWGQSKHAHLAVVQVLVSSRASRRCYTSVACVCTEVYAASQNRCLVHPQLCIISCLSLPICLLTVSLLEFSPSFHLWYVCAFQYKWCCRAIAEPMGPFWPCAMAHFRGGRGVPHPGTSKKAAGLPEDCSTDGGSVWDDQLCSGYTGDDQFHGHHLPGMWSVSFTAIIYQVDVQGTSTTGVLSSDVHHSHLQRSLLFA